MHANNERTDPVNFFQTYTQSLSRFFKCFFFVKLCFNTHYPNPDDISKIIKIGPVVIVYVD